MAQTLTGLLSVIWRLSTWRAPPAMALSDEDLSQQVSLLLRRGTARAHESAEHSQGASWLVKGQLDKSEYARFLMVLWTVYSALEAALDKHRDEPVLKPTYNPSILSRSAALSSDIAFLLGIAEWQRHPLFHELARSPPKKLSTFVERLHSLSGSSDAAYLLLAHAYVRYLGDLSGGQMIRRTLIKAYDLPQNGDGIKFYMFFDGEGEISPTGIKDLKEWYRDGMNAGVGDDDMKKEALVKEAVLSFQLNQELFSTIRGPGTLEITPMVEKLAGATLYSVPTILNAAPSPTLGLHPITIGKYTYTLPRWTAFILIAALFGAIQFVSARYQ